MTDSHDRPLTIAVLIWTGVVSAYTTVLLPLIVSGAARSFGVPPGQAGYAASAEMGGIAIGALYAGTQVARLDRRRLVIASALIGLFANAAAALVGDFHFVLLLRFVAGLGGGGMLATMAASTGATREPDRNFAIFVAAAFVAAALGFGFLSRLVAASGLASLFWVLAALNAGVIATSPFYPRFAGTPGTETGGTRGGWTMPVLIGLGGIIAYYIGIGSVWPMMGTVGEAAGLTPASVNAVLATTAIAGVAGALSATALAVRLGRIMPLAVGLTLVVSSLLWLTMGGAGTFRTAPLLFQFAWNFSVPYMLGTLSVLDPTGRAVAVNMTLQYVGFAAGPLIAAATVTSAGLDAVLWIGIVGSALSLVLFLAASAAARRATV